jgi:benzoyl-CoA reductase/2-hydroxyglutaryl-CoA dehydratase subunit BcrC/BadD/HgdB
VDEEMKFELDEDSLNKRAEEVYADLLKVSEMMKKMDLPIDNSNHVRTMVISAYVLGAKDVVEKLNETNK